MPKKDIKKILSKMEEMFPDAKGELNHQTPFQLVVAVVLSANTTDKQVNKATAKLFQTVKKPKDLLQYNQYELEQIIKSVGTYHNKAKYLLNIANTLIQKYDGQIPNNIDDLTAMSWIGAKSAKIILNILYDASYIPVDTHIHRVSNRLGIVKTSTPDKTSQKLEEIIPDKYKSQAHFTIVLFGRYHCTARNPKCCTCKLQNLCDYFKNNDKKCLNS